MIGDPAGQRRHQDGARFVGRSGAAQAHHNGFEGQMKDGVGSGWQHPRPTSVDAQHTADGAQFVMAR